MIGMLRARIDNELIEADLEQITQHLASCAACRSRMGKLANDATGVQEFLATVTPRPEPVSVDAISAYAAFRNQVAAEQQEEGSWLERLFCATVAPSVGIDRGGSDRWHIPRIQSRTPLGTENPCHDARAEDRGRFYRPIHAGVQC